MVSYIFFIAFTLNVFFIISSYAAALGSKTQHPYLVIMDSVKMEALQASLESSSRTWHEEIIESISISNQDDHDQSPPSPEISNFFDTIIPAGFSAMLTEQQLESLERIDGFVTAIKDELLPLHTTHSSRFLGLRAGKGLWNAQNLASDVIIGVVDTGIWPEHLSFKDLDQLTSVPARWKGSCKNGTKFKESNCNKKLIGARAFFQGYESAIGRINETSDYRSARDSDGHGTHTASTAGGNIVEGANLLGRAEGNATGTRPTARLAIYKACFQQGCMTSDLLAAMEQAVKDGVDVLSLSLGGEATPYYNDTVAIGAFHAIRKGVIISMSAGNSGPDSYTVGNVAPWLMTVAASTMDCSLPAQVRLGDGRIFKGTTAWSGKPTTKSLPLAYYKSNRNATLCLPGSLSPALVKGKIVICVRGGGIAGVAKGEAVKAAGGAGMILANTVRDGEDLITDAHVLPALSLGFSEANAVINYTKSSSTSSPPMATIVFQGDVLGDRAPVMASFSSRGPNPVDLNILKPDVTAPGVNILAAWPPNVSPTELKSDKRSVLYNIISGTSMSCPHVSGIMALLKSLHPHWSPAAVKSALMTTAYVHDSENKPISDGAAAVGSNGSEPTDPFVFGSGHIDPERAADPGLIYDISAQDYLNYLCGLGYNSTQMELFVGKKNSKTTNCTRPGDLNYPSFSLGLRRNFTGTTSYTRTVTNVGIGVNTYSVNVTEQKGVSIAVRPTVCYDH